MDAATGPVTSARSTGSPEFLQLALVFLTGTSTARLDRGAEISLAVPSARRSSDSGGHRLGSRA
jgi:hypothetical protein